MLGEFADQLSPLVGIDIAFLEEAWKKARAVRLEVEFVDLEDVQQALRIPKFRCIDNRGMVERITELARTESPF